MVAAFVMLLEEIGVPLGTWCLFLHSEAGVCFGGGSFLGFWGGFLFVVVWFGFVFLVGLGEEGCCWFDLVFFCGEGCRFGFFQWWYSVWGGNLGETVP